MLDIRWTIQRVPGNNPTLAARIETDSDSDYLAAERERFQQEAHQLQLENYVSRIGHEVNNSNFVALSSVTTLADIWAGVLPVLDQYRAENGDFVVSAQNYGDIREEATELFGLLVDAIRRARQTVEDFRDRIPKLDAAIEDRLDATSVLHDALTLLAPVLLRRVGLVSTASYAGVPPICGNRRRLQHILAILLKNAAEATEYATETINVTVEPHKNGTSCVFEFKDTGVGITAEVQTKAFEPFFTTHREQGHLGLGLAIAKCIVIEHGGALELRQREARGTCARLTIPHREQ